ncbi:MAG: paraslipin [Desulfovibrionaceae bacterium]
MNSIDPISTLLTVALCIFFGVVIYKSVVIIPNKQANVIERLGKFYATYESGFHILIPFLDKIAYIFSLKEQVIDAEKQQCITKDNVQLSIDGVIYLQIVTPDKAAYGVEDYTFAAIQLAQTSLRSGIGTMNLDETFENRDRINQIVTEALMKATENWGIKVLRYEIKDIVPPQNILMAMNKQMEAEREKRAQVLTSEGIRDAAINRAEGEKRAQIAKAEGEAAAVRLEADAKAYSLETVGLATKQNLLSIASALEGDSGLTAANLRVAEAYVHSFGNIAKESTTLLLPANMVDIGTMTATAMQVLGKLQSK